MPTRRPLPQCALLLLALLLLWLCWRCPAVLLP